MTFVADNLGSEEELKKIYFKMGLYRKKGDKLLQSYFFSIKDSSVGFDKAQEVILVFDKSCRLEMEAKEAGNTFYPSFKFYNAPQGFKKELQATQDKIVGVVVDTDCSSTLWMEMLRECQMARPSTPVMMVAKDPKSLAAFDKASLGIKIIIPRTLGPAKIIEKLKNIELDVSPTPPLFPPSANVLNGGESGYIAISRSLFILCSHTTFDLYVRVGEKYIKVVEQGGEVVPPQRNKEKESDLFYITRIQYQSFLSMVDSEIDRILSADDIEFSQKKIHFDDYCGETLENLKNLGVEEVRLEQAKRLIGQSEKMLLQMMQQHAPIQQLVLDFMAFEHSVSVAMIVGLFLKEIDAKTFVFEDIFFAALLHDLGLLNFGHEARSEDLKQMSEQDKEAFYQHPERGAELAKKMGVKPILCQAIAHHHQRLNGEGFPKTEKGKAAVVNRIGELIGLAEELVFLVNTAVDDDALLPTEKLRLNLTDRYSPSIKSAYQKIFPVIS